jgi:DNA-binding MarR family transcriptional regulator
MAMLAYGALRFLKRRWFYGLIEPTPDNHMAALLISVYHSTTFVNRPINRKGVWLEMGVQDLKTARKYMKRAEDLGLVIIEQSPTDGRMELLHPTAKLKALARKELELFGAEIYRSMYEITNVDQYAIGIRGDNPIIRPVKGDWVGKAMVKEVKASIEKRRQRNLKRRKKQPRRKE